ncbi:Uncharacterized protein dnl_41690 [Desulfonema limicola]|uniref:Uncharacterized protein n=1 Tax=Desulfonema limicola TaxID=45656 RepID=A0A975BAH5_9BACT|nr:hypothetical protein [Desulfonema limicola]QTA81818.1 Uncharacterized protein dnl_41690 [Desulfonema limicola]
MNQYQLFKDMIEILTPSNVLKILEKKIKVLSRQDIAFTIFEVIDICPYCNDSGFVNRKKCPVCTADAEACLKYQMNRIGRYQNILKYVPEIWDGFIQGKEGETNN